MPNFAHFMLRQNKIYPHVKEECVGRTCYKQKVETWHQTLTFLGGTKMLRKYSKISMFNILRTRLSLKMMSNAYISNDMIIMLYHIIIRSIL